MVFPAPPLDALAAGPIGPRLERIHSCVRAHFRDVGRIAAALYDERSDRLKTFVHSTDGGAPIDHYEASLADVPSLDELAHSGQPRVVDDLEVFRGSPSEHTRRLLERGYRSSYSLPLREGERLWGFLFFDSTLKGYFQPAVTQRIDVFGQMVAAILAHSIAPIRLLFKTLRMVSTLTHYRDPETLGHLERMSRYCRLIAQELARRGSHSDEYVEFVFMFAPIHDVGKIAIPDAVLLKEDRLTEAEFEIMKEHAAKGGEIVDQLVSHLGLEAFPHIDVLRNVVRFHHEAVDGSGYPLGLSGDAIPLEARIVAVADVFDALTSRRRYKRAWRTDEALPYLRELAGRQFDPACVDALHARLDDADAIQLLFPDAADDPYQSREGYGYDL
ncbi:MAG: HD-GYP domain-containing protein [Vicinamibacteria bacterium]